MTDPNMTWPCPRCRVPQGQASMYCQSCGLALGAAQADPDDNPVSAALTRASVWVAPIVIIGVVLVIAFALIGGVGGLDTLWRSFGR